MSEIDRMAEEAIRIYKEWLRDRSIARPYEEFRRERGLVNQAEDQGGDWHTGHTVEAKCD